MSQQRNRHPLTEPDLLDRPLTARSVVLSLLLGRHPARAGVALLVRWCELFEISENATRVALSRMVGHRELTAVNGVYELVGRVRDRQAEQELAVDPPVAEWAGDWHVVVVVASGRPAAERAERRATMRHAHFAELGDAVWVRPDNLAVPPVLVEELQSWRWRGAPQDVDPVVLAARLFDIDALMSRGHRVLARLEATRAQVDGGDLAGAFVVGAAALQYLRRDPLLPPALIPPGWPGDVLRVAYADFQHHFSDAVSRWYRAE